MKAVNFLLLFFLLLSINACSQSNKKNQIPEVGIYTSITTSVENQYEWEYNPYTKQSEMRLKPHVQIMPSAFGDLEIKADGTYEFAAQKKGGKYSYNENTKKINFTGYMDAGEATFSYSKSTCILLINVKGKSFSLQYEKKSNRPLSETQPDLKNPNSTFSGTIVGALSYQSVDYIDLATSTTTNTFSYTGLTKAINNQKSIHIEKLDVLSRTDDPVIEIRDRTGNIIASYLGVNKNKNAWRIGKYKNAALSTDGSKFVFDGTQWEATAEFYGQSMRTYKNVVIAVCDAANGNLLKTFETGTSKIWGASWLANGGLLLPSTNGGIDITNNQFNNRNTIYNQTVDFAKSSPDGKLIIFKKGSQLFTINVDGSNEKKVTNKEVNLGFEKTSINDLCFSPDSKSIAISMADEYISNNYKVLMVSLDGEKASMLKNVKGETTILRWPSISWISNENNNTNVVATQSNNNTQQNATVNITTNKIIQNPTMAYVASPQQTNKDFEKIWEYYTKVMEEDVENFNDPAVALTYIICLNYAYYTGQQSIPTNQVQKIYNQFVQKLLQEKDLFKNDNNVKEQLTKAIIQNSIETFKAVSTKNEGKIKEVALQMLTKYIGKAANNLKITDNGMEY